MLTHQKIEFRMVRDFGQILNDTFEFLRFNFKPLVRCLFFIAGPFVFLGAVGSIMAQSALQTVRETLDFTSIGAGFAITVIAGIFSYLCVILVTYTYILIYDDSETGEVELDQVWQRCKQGIGNMVITSIWANILWLAGMMFLIIPGIYLFVRFSIIWIIRLNERISFFKAISRTGYLMQGFWWRSFGMLIIIFFLQSIFTSAAQLPFFILEMAVAFNTGGEVNSVQEYPIISSIFLMLSALSQFTIAMPCIAISLYYYSLVEYREGTGLLMRLESVLETPAPRVESPDDSSDDTPEETPEETPDVPDDTSDDTPEETSTS